jgi:hypothetical protein
MVLFRYLFVFRLVFLGYRFVFWCDMLRSCFVFRVEMLRYRFVFRVEMLRYRKKGKAANVQVLAAAALHRQAGLKTVLTAIKEYQQACSTGTVRTIPAKCYDETKLPWLP